ncbi:hypothetical protein BC938DRAFT_483473 [Jimgerdemannia flammicorona]|uniref:VWFA domain-containing protein n=1 Tax=Jimgerdemannia flammicorona TaxID=994334 RepID=A0A433QC23_9FUNG|nr:hypothetical protein BC938DRAFT_483473 [Jimgerdemannia flammicorona]
MSAVLASTAPASVTQTIAVPQPLSWRVDLEINDHNDHNDHSKPQTVSFNEVNTVFAVDISGSVAGGVLVTEKNLVKAVATDPRHLTNSKVVAWDHGPRDPVPLSEIDRLAASGGTSPECILTCNSSAHAIEQSGAWFLVTDGDIDSHSVERFASQIVKHNITHIPAVIVVVGYSVTSNQIPAKANISVGASVFFLADHCLFLYADSTEWNAGKRLFYLLQAKGCFEHLGVVESISQSVQWSDLPVVVPEVLSDILLPKTEARAGGGITRLNDSLYIRIDTLLNPGTCLTQADLHDIFNDEATRMTFFHACKARGLLQNLRSFISRHKIEEITSVEDFANAQAILRRLTQARQSAAPIETLLALQSQLRDAYRQNEQHNRDNFLVRRADARAHNAILELALRELFEIERAGYSADQLGRLSNRAARADIVSENELTNQLDDLNFDPAGTDSFRRECPICCEEDAVMAITCKVLPSDKVEANTNDFALNFPLACGSATHNADVISAQIACYQCANYTVSEFGRTIVREEATVVVPLVSLAKNAKLWRTRLAVALTNRIQVGNLVQLFMAVLDETLEHKGWARAEDGDAEVRFRRDALEWTLGMLWREFRTRKNFLETGEMVQFPNAVAFVIEEASSAGGSVEPWLIRYPIEGFLRIMRLAKRFNVPGLPLDEGLHLFHTRIMALLVDNYHAHIKRGGLDIAANRIWAALYDLRHGKTPIEGTARLVMNIDDLIHPSSLKNVKDYLISIGREPTFPFPAATTILLRRLLEIKNHDSVAHCFVELRAHDTAVIQALEHPDQVADQDALDILNEMFFPELAHDSHITSQFVPFVTPYGPSVAKCEYCDELFAPPGTEDTVEMLALKFRQGRQAHFIKHLNAFGDTGLPLRAPIVNGRLMPPSKHYNLHHNVVAVYAELSEDERKALLETGSVGEAGWAEEQRASMEAFANAVVERIVGVDLRGNIYDHNMEEDVWNVLKSFWEIVRRDGFEPEKKQVRMVEKLRMELKMLGWSTKEETEGLTGV